jgi:hypothetical protein
LDKIVLERLAAAFDKVIDNFIKDEESIFPDEKTRTILKYKNAKAILTAWDKSQNCIYKGCKEKSIPRSHSIQKASSLKLISEDNHVLAVEFDIHSGKLKTQKVGINMASTFPGFCKQHEALFSDFEADKEIVNSEDFTLQIYRSVCREIVKKNYHIGVLEKRKDQYLSFRDKKIAEHLRNELGDEFIEKHKIKLSSLKFTNLDYRQDQITSEIKKLKKDIDGFLNKFQAGIVHDILTKKSLKIYGTVLVLDIELPVCLAGRGNFQVTRKSKTVNVDAILNVLPYLTKTYIIAAVLSKFKSELDMYIGRFSNPLETVNMVESWMLHGSDHWFIKPSVWDKIQPQFKKDILNDIWDFSKNIGHKYKYSILNDVKRLFLDIAATADARNIHPNLQRLLLEEKNKLTDIPS